MTTLLLPFPTGNITSHYGQRDIGFHDGTDWGKLPVGTPIPASGVGRVHSITYSERGGWRVGIQYSGVPGTFLYCHLNGRPVGLKVGDTVRAGTIIGQIGWSGNVLPKGPGGAHLHLSHYLTGNKHQSPLATMKGGVAKAGSPAPAASAGDPAIGATTKLKGKAWVTAMQEKYRRLGHDLGPHGVDGKDGPRFVQITRWEQERAAGNGFGPLVVDGVAGDRTNAYVDWQLAKKAVVAQPGRPVIRKGSRGRHVGDLQRHLKANYPLYASHLAVDEDFGAATEAVVKEFQRRAGLVPDGVVGEKTWARLGL